MSERNVDNIRSHYQSAARGEIRSLRLLDERIGEEHRGVPDNRDVPDLSNMPDPVDEPRWRPERFIDLHERVLVRVKLSGRARSTGEETETRQAHLWNVRRGRGVTLAIYHDWESGLEAAGVAE
jgi:ketosteroid isomerase-like protein